MLGIFVAVVPIHGVIIKKPSITLPLSFSFASIAMRKIDDMENFNEKRMEFK